MDDEQSEALEVKQPAYDHGARMGQIESAAQICESRWGSAGHRLVLICTCGGRIGSYNAEPGGAQQFSSTHPLPHPRSCEALYFF